MTIQYQGLPPQSTPLVNEDRTVNIVWYRFFLSLHQATGLWALPIAKLPGGGIDPIGNFTNPLIMFGPPDPPTYPNGRLLIYDPADDPTDLFNWVAEITL